ncbi:Ubiquitin carboxyl-terminal hydrolase [Operophtera brumata]|uniref:ubiquitinyl hydrolase 1 n=1 Tax=Operophtera brumata TaxID=104452 RepID=A0A0L7LVC1_OPEBR|nr:Ubiquitin carboxyl-terminal hydrolase [Operophtera brumata]
MVLKVKVGLKYSQNHIVWLFRRAWHEYTKSKESLILRLFHGQIKSTVQCTVCGKQSLTYDSFSNLSLELPANASRCSLSVSIYKSKESLILRLFHGQIKSTDCLKLYLNGETIPGWNCPNCKDKRDALKKLDISRLPPVLVIHFKRFYVDPKEYMCNSYRKRQTYIDFPLEDLDMRQFSLHGPGNSLYNLWYKYDDHVVSEISPSEVKSSAAYILFYSSVSAPAPS